LEQTVAEFLPLQKLYFLPFIPNSGVRAPIALNTLIPWL
jgi:hypothetical protein